MIIVKTHRKGEALDRMSHYIYIVTNKDTSVKLVSTYAFHSYSQLDSESGAYSLQIEGLGLLAKMHDRVHSPLPLPLLDL